MTSPVVGRHPNGSCASARVTLSRGTTSQPHRRHHRSGSTTRQDSTARSVSSCCRTTLEAAFIEPAERGQVRPREGSVQRDEVLQLKV